MKAVLLLCALSVAAANEVRFNYPVTYTYPNTANVVPFTYNTAGNVVPFTYNTAGNVVPSTYNTAGNVVPYTYNTAGNVVPFNYPTPYTFPVTYSKSFVTPVVAPGYVAKNRGAEHYAPLPANTPYASHHINVAPAPGTE